MNRLEYQELRGRRPGNANARRAFGKFTRPWPEGMGAAVSRED